MKKKTLTIGLGVLLALSIFSAQLMKVSCADITCMHVEIWDYDVIIFDSGGMNYTGNTFNRNTSTYCVFADDNSVNDDGILKEDLKLVVSYSSPETDNGSLQIVFDVNNRTEGVYNASITIFLGSDHDSVSSDNLSKTIAISYHVSSRSETNLEINIESLVSEAFANWSLPYVRSNLKFRGDNVSADLAALNLTHEGDDGVFESKLRIVFISELIMDDESTFTLSHFQIGEKPDNPGSGNNSYYIIIIAILGGGMLTTIAIKTKRPRGKTKP